MNIFPYICWPTHFPLYIYVYIEIYIYITPSEHCSWEFLLNFNALGYKDVCSSYSCVLTKVTCPLFNITKEMNTEWEQLGLLFAVAFLVNKY